MMGMADNLIIKDARMMTPRGMVLGDIRICDGCIAQMGESLTGGDIWQAHGAVVAPGYIDMHVHGCGGASALDGLDGLIAMSRTLARHGVTTFLPTIEAASAQDMRKALEAVARHGKDLPGARAPGAHLEGPFIGTQYKGALNSAHFLPPALEHYLSICEGLEDAVARITIDPALPGAIPFIQEISRRGVLVSIGHTDADADLCDAAILAGARMATHLFNAMPALHHRAPGPVGAALANADCAVELIADMVHIEPRVLKLAAAAKGHGRTALVSDAMAAAGMPDGAYALGGLRVLVKDGQARLSDGTLAGSTLFLDQAVRNMAQIGFPARQSVQMASAVPARLLGMKAGELRAGYAADLVVLDEQLNVTRTFVAGRAGEML